MCPKSYPPPNLQDQEYVRLHDKGELRLQMELRLPISCSLNWEVILDYSSEPKGITPNLKSGGGGLKKESVKEEVTKSRELSHHW